MIPMIKGVFTNYIQPLFMVVLGVPLMGFGAANLSGWEGLFRVGSAFFGFLTAIGGFVITILGIVWWIRKLHKQRGK